MYDELFDVLYEACLTEDAGGARGKYIQVQKEKLKKLEEKKKALEVRMSHAMGDDRNKYSHQLSVINLEIHRVKNKIETVDNDDDKILYNKKQKEGFKYLFHDNDTGDANSIHSKINRRAEAKK